LAKKLAHFFFWGEQQWRPLHNFLIIYNCTSTKLSKPKNKKRKAAKVYSLATILRTALLGLDANQAKLLEIFYPSNE
jgi:hypothetical protein